MISACPEWDDVLQRPGEVITTVSIDGLEEAEGDPDVHCEDVEVSGDGAVEDGTDDSSCA